MASDNYEPPRPKLLKTTRDCKKAFVERLYAAKANMEKRLKRNACPKSNISNYKIEGYLGQGGYADVVKVGDRGMTYALKVVKKSREEKEFRNRRIITEKKLTDAMQFKFIIELHFVYQDARHFYLFLDCTQYGDLLHYLKDYGSDESQVKWFAVQIILALEYMHECDILHRDLKPENILLFANGYLKVSDFGFSKIVEHRTRSIVGSPSYMAPEIIGKEPYGKSVDWWSFGVVLYQMMYRKRPFRKYEPFEELKFPAEAIHGSSVCDLISRLLEKAVFKRLGCLEGGAKDIMKHDWFSDISICDVYAKNLKLELLSERIEPYVPEDNAYEFLEGNASDPELKWYDSFCEES